MSCDLGVRKLLNQQAIEHQLQSEIESASDDMLFEEILRTKSGDYIQGWMDRGELISEHASRFLALEDKHNRELVGQFPQYFANK